MTVHDDIRLIFKGMCFTPNAKVCVVAVDDDNFCLHRDVHAPLEM